MKKSPRILFVGNFLIRHWGNGNDDAPDGSGWHRHANEEHFAVMAKKAVGGDTLHGFIDLKQHDVEEIFNMCMK